jgi:hypothetical protein
MSPDEPGVLDAQSGQRSRDSALADHEVRERSFAPGSPQRYNPPVRQPIRRNTHLLGHPGAIGHKLRRWRSMSIMIKSSTSWLCETDGSRLSRGENLPDQSGAQLIRSGSQTRGWKK